MVTRRSTHANHAKPSTASKRRANRRAASESAPLYAGGKANARGGHVGNVAGFGTGSGGSSRGAAPSVGNVAGYGTGSTNVRSGGAHRRTTSPGTGHATPRATTGGNTSGPRIPTPSGGEILLTRRHFLFGALGIGALAAIGGGAAVVAQQMEKDPDADLTVLKVPASAVTSSDSLANVDDYRTRMSLTGSFELPYGTLVWANDEHVAACLLPAESAKPLTHVALLALGSGVSTTVLEGAVGLDEGFEIYDVRATSSGLVWTEADILDGIWRIYTARSAGTSIGEPVLVEEGNADYETPSIAAVGNRAFWQVLPKPKGAKKAESSLLKRATMGASDTEVVYTSRGRMATPPYASNDSVIITPRTDTSSIHYQLTCIDANSGNVKDSLALPVSMKPLEAGYGKTGFTFSFDAGYDYGDGISKVGTYTPTIAATNADYSNAPWFWFGRAPSAPPAWCGKYFMVKSTTAVCGVDFATNEYFAFDVESGADDYGEYLASTGSHDTVVTFANIDHVPLGGEPVKCCRVRVWTPTA